MLEDNEELSDRMLYFLLEMVADSLETGLNWQSEKNHAAALIIRNVIKILEARSQEPGARSQEPGARSQEPGARSQEPGARSQEPGARSQLKKNNRVQEDILFFICLLILGNARYETGEKYLRRSLFGK